MRKPGLQIFGILLAALLFSSGIWHELAHHAAEPMLHSVHESGAHILPCNSDAHHFHARHRVPHAPSGDMPCPICAGLLQYLPPSGAQPIPAAAQLREPPPRPAAYPPGQASRLPRSRAPPQF